MSSRTEPQSGSPRQPVASVPALADPLKSSPSSPAAGMGSWRALGLSLALVALITSVKLIWAKQLGSAPPFLLYFSAIVIAGWYGGVRLGLTATVVAGVLGSSLFLPFPSADTRFGVRELLLLLAFVVEGGVLSVLTSRLQSGRARAAAAAQQAQLSAAKLRSVLGAVDDGITVQDGQGRLIYANEPAAVLSGFPSADALLRATPQEIGERFELFAPDGSPFPTSELPGQRVLRGLPAPERLIRFRLRGSDDERWSLVRANPVQLDGAAVPFAVNAFRDVTALRVQQEELRLSREWFATALRSIGDAVIATDASGRITFMNPQAETLTGWSNADADRKPLDEVFRIVDEDTREVVENPAARVLREGRVVGLANHTLLLARSGAEYAVDDSAAPIRSESNELAGTVLVFRDVSNKRQEDRRRAFIARATAELTASLDHQQTLATLARLAVPDIADLCTIDIREAAGWRRLAVEHVDSKKRELLLELERRYPVDPNKQRALDIRVTGKPVYLPNVSDAELKLVAQDDEHFATLRALGIRSFIGVPLRARGELIGVFNIAHSESPRRYRPEDLELAGELADRAGLAIANARLFADMQAARTDAEQANRAKDEFLAMLGHELRNPLAPIVTALQLMKLKAADVFEKERSIVERQVRHVVTLVDDLLDVSRITRGKVELSREPVELAATVDKALELAGPLLEQRQHDVAIEVPKDIVVRGDPVRLAQVVSNLLTNAAKYTPPRGHIELAATQNGSEVCLSVRDDGIGIEPELLPRIFDLFVQGGQSIDRSQGGLGLGLAIVRSVVELHGGRVSVKSDGRGKGSEFSVTLPLLSRTSVVPQPSAASASVVPAAGSGATVLIVDDNQDALQMLAEALQVIGYEAHVAEDPARALAIAERIQPSIALLDIGLPVMNGYELARRLRSLPGLEAIKLAAITGYGQPSDKERAHEAGFDEHLVKPISIERVRQVVVRLLGG